MDSVTRSRLHARRGVAAIIAAGILLAGLMPVSVAKQPSPNGRPAAPARPAAMQTVSVPAMAPIAVPGRRPSADPKLDSQLAEVAAAGDEAAGLARARGAALRIVGRNIDTVVQIADGSRAAVTAAIVRAGGTAGYVANRGRWIEALLPVAALRALAARGDVTAIRVPQPVYEAATPNAGTFMTEGDAALNGPAWRGEGWDGTGIKVGVMDVGFQGYPGLLGTELPASVTVESFVTGETDANVDGTTVHGTACAEIVHDIAPGAELFLAKVGSSTDIEEAADWLVDVNGVDIITSSIGIYNITPGDGTGYYHDIIQEKRDAGTTWFTAASNDREAHWGGLYDDLAAVPGTHEWAAGQNVNYYGPAGTNTAYIIPSGNVIRGHLRWDDWTHPVDQDYDLLLLRSISGGAWTVVASSVNDQNGTAGQFPTENIGYATTTANSIYGFLVQRFSSTVGVNLEFFAPKIAGLEERVHARSLSNLADANAAVTVAALHRDSPYPQEPYSSEGPTNGPGGALAGGINKPDISGYAVVDTSSYGNDGFNGTSAATPHVAGAAALLLDANTTYDPDTVEFYLTSFAHDLGAPGTDTVFGAGRVHLGTPMDGTAPTVTAPRPGFKAGAPGVPGTRVSNSTTPIPIQMTFTATDTSGIGDTELQRRLNAGPFSDVPLPNPTSVAVKLNFAPHASNTHTFQARATDNASNTSAFAPGTAFKVKAQQDAPGAALVYAGAWTSQTATGANGFYGTTVRHASAAARKATFSFTATDVAFVTTFGPDRGKVQLRLDGTIVGTFDLYQAGSLATRQIVYRKHFASSGAHILEVRVLGTKNPASTGTRVDADAFLTISP